MNLIEEIQEIQEWLLKEQNTKILLNEPSKEIRDYLNYGINIEDCTKVLTKFRSISIWTGNLFLNELQSCGKNIACISSTLVDQKYYHVRVRIIRIDSGGSARISPTDIHFLFFLLLAFNRHEQALWLGGRTYIGDTPERFSGRKDEVWTLREVSEWESLGGDVTGWGSIVAKLRRLIPGQKEKECSAGKLPDDPMFPYWEDKPLCGYMLRLWLVMSGQIASTEIPAGHPHCGVYEGLFRHWNDPVALERSLIDALDYHVRRSSEEGDGDYDIPEFTLRPYNVIPFEILAYRNVRARMGLETPLPSHPLLDSPFVKNLPDELPPSDDPLLQEVLTAVRKVLPEV
jgi:hypothetical protein